MDLVKKINTKLFWVELKKQFVWAMTEACLYFSFLILIYFKFI